MAKKAYFGNEAEPVGLDWPTVDRWKTAFQQELKPGGHVITDEHLAPTRRAEALRAVMSEFRLPASPGDGIIAAVNVMAARARAVFGIPGAHVAGLRDVPPWWKSLGYVNFHSQVTNTGQRSTESRRGRLVRYGCRSGCGTCF